MDNNSPGFLRGQFLMAMPGLTDPNFNNTVTCLCEHSREGAVGIVINRVHSNLQSKDIFEELKMQYVPAASSLPIYMGGPVHLGEIFILHDHPFHWEGCHRITPELAMSNTKDILQAIAMDRGPKSVVIAIGCAGWGPDQLETEIMENVWLTCPVAEDIVFRVSVEERWEASMRKMGINPALLMDTAGHA